MVLESCQLMSTAMRSHGGNPKYKSTHKGHPCTIWASSSRENYLWLYKHTLGLMAQFRIRRGKSHACETLLNELREGAELLPSLGLQPFVNCARNQSKGVDYKHLTDVPLAYKLYLSERWETDKMEPVWT